MSADTSRSDPARAGDFSPPAERIGSGLDHESETPVSAILTIVHFAATWYLVGLCWLVQRVQYPLMVQVGAEGFAAYEQAHVTRIGPVVGPMMIVEAATAVALFFTGASFARHPAFLGATALVALIWASTFLVQVPLHGVLGQSFDADAHTALVRTNWIRTLAWTARGLLLAWLLHAQGFFGAGANGAGA